MLLSFYLINIFIFNWSKSKKIKLLSYFKRATNKKFLLFFFIFKADSPMCKQHISFRYNNSDENKSEKERERERVCH